MNRSLRFSLYVIFFTALYIITADFCHDKTKGFQIQKIAANLPFEAKWGSSVSYSKKEQEEVFLALEQPFRYLKKGKYCYVFSSEDERYVLKFFQAPQILPPFWTTLPFFHTLFPSTCTKILAQKKAQKELNFTSYKRSFEELKEQNGTLYLHLNPTHDLPCKVTLYDPIGVKHVLSLDPVSFILQKKALPFCPFFMNLLSTQQEEKAKELLVQFACMLKERADKGICDKDISPRYNLGILEGKLVTFDLDSLRAESLEVTAHMMQDGKKMLKWLESTRPDLALFLQKTILSFAHLDSKA